MKTIHRSLLAALCGCSLAVALTGCQSTVGGQTLPSAHYLRDDVQYHPAGPEFLLTRQVEAIEQYNVDRSGFRNSFDETAQGNDELQMGGGASSGGAYDN